MLNLQAIINVLSAKKKWCFLYLLGILKRSMWIVGFNTLRPQQQRVSFCRFVLVLGNGLALNRWHYLTLWWHRSPICMCGSQSWLVKEYCNILFIIRITCNLFPINLSSNCSTNAKQATSHYLNQGWPSSPACICGTRGRWADGCDLKDTMRHPGIQWSR